MDVKFTVVTRELLGEVEKSDGQIIALYDEPGLYYEMDNKRYSVMGMQLEKVQQKPDASSIQNPNDHTFYFYNSQSDDGGLYIYDENSSSFILTSRSEINIYKVTIPSNGWTAIAGGSGYKQDVSTSASMTANSVIISVRPASNSTAAQKAAFEQWDSIETKAGKITITAPIQISTDFGIVIIETPEAN